MALHSIFLSLTEENTHTLHLTWCLSAGCRFFPQPLRHLRQNTTSSTSKQEQREITSYHHHRNRPTTERTHKHGACHHQGSLLGQACFSFAQPSRGLMGPTEKGHNNIMLYL
ncbi:unnamed protein product, partial [Ectocarpus sp. 12 AP-2014]